MKLRQHWVARRHVQSPCSIPSRVATLSHHLPAEGKRLHLTSGSLSMKSPQYYLPCQQIHGADDFMCILETYVVLLYNRTCTETTVVSARKHILCSKAGQSKPYHPQDQHCFNTRNGLHTKVDMCGDKHMSVLQNFLRQRPAGGESVPHKDGSRCGHCFQRQSHRVQNCYAAGGRKRE